MIRHLLDTDTRLAYDWRDDEDEPVAVTSAKFVAWRSGFTGIEWDETDAGLNINGAYPIELHLDDALDIAPGNYEYELLAQADGEWTIISAGLLRVRDSLSIPVEPEPEPEV